MAAIAETKKNCPLDNKCLKPQLVYQADVTNGTDEVPLMALTNTT